MRNRPTLHDLRFQRLGSKRDGGGGAIPVTPADYIITNNAEWVSMAAIPAATLSGKIAEIRGDVGQVALANKDMTAPLTIRQGSGGRIVSLGLTGTVSKLTLSGVNFQMTGWPRTAAQIVQFGTGTFDEIVFSGCSFRHGYGHSLANFDVTADLPEYARIDNVQTATTVSQTFPLSWLDTSAAGGFVEFFNRGTNPVYVNYGGSGVTATTANTLVAAGTGKRSATLIPATATHFAIISTGGSSQVNARAEIGLTEYLANTFAAFGSSNMGRIEVRGCTLRDVNNGIKGIGTPTLGIVMDNDLDRIYQDIMAVPPASGGAVYVMRNLGTVPFSRSGIAENLFGDARDPHGDFLQSFGSGLAPMGQIFSAGNRMRRPLLRTGATCQGLFLSDNDFNPSYQGIWSISDLLLGGSTNGISTGEASYPATDIMVWGGTVLDPLDLTGSGATVRMTTADVNRAYVGRTISHSFNESGGAGWADEDNLATYGNGSATGWFPNIGGLVAATTRSAVEAALTTANEASTLGAVASANAIDWTTTNHESVIQWANVSSGVAWDDLTAQTVGVTLELPLRKVLNRRPNQTVNPGSGIEWRTTASDGTTEVQAWTASAGVVQPDQFIQVRGQTSVLGFTSVQFAVTINGFLTTTNVRTAAITPTVFHTQSGTGPYFRDPANAVPASTTRMEFKANIYPTSVPASTIKLFAQESTGCDLELTNSGSFRFTVEDGSGASLIAYAAGLSSYALNQWQELLLDVDQVAGTATLTNNGVLAGSWSWTPGGSPFFQTGREISFVGMTSGTNLAPAGWQIEFVECYFTTSGVRTLRKRVDGNAAVINADAWKLGGNAT